MWLWHRLLAADMSQLSARLMLMRLAAQSTDVNVLKIVEDHPCLLLQETLALDSQASQSSENHGKEKRNAKPMPLGIIQEKLMVHSSFPLQKTVACCCQRPHTMTATAKHNNIDECGHRVRIKMLQSSLLIPYSLRVPRMYSGLSLA